MKEKKVIKELVCKVVVSDDITKEISDIKKMCKYYHSDIQRLNFELETIKEDQIPAIEKTVNQLTDMIAKEKPKLSWSVSALRSPLFANQLSENDIGKSELKKYKALYAGADKVCKEYFNETVELKNN